MENLTVERTKTFKWNSREELYCYFEGKYSLHKELIDTSIEKTIQKFRPRKHQIIKTQELWEKVGNSLESELNLRTSAGNDD